MSEWQRRTAQRHREGIPQESEDDEELAAALAQIAEYEASHGRHEEGQQCIPSTAASSDLDHMRPTLLSEMHPLYSRSQNCLNTGSVAQVEGNTRVYQTGVPTTPKETPVIAISPSMGNSSHSSLYDELIRYHSEHNDSSYFDLLNVEEEDSRALEIEPAISYHRLDTNDDQASPLVHERQSSDGSDSRMSQSSTGACSFASASASEHHAEYSPQNQFLGPCSSRSSTSRRRSTLKRRPPISRQLFRRDSNGDDTERSTDEIDAAPNCFFPTIGHARSAPAALPGAEEDRQLNSIKNAIRMEEATVLRSNQSVPMYSEVLLPSELLDRHEPVWMIPASSIKSTELRHQQPSKPKVVPHSPKTQIPSCQLEHLSIDGAFLNPYDHSRTDRRSLLTPDGPAGKASATHSWPASLPTDVNVPVTMKSTPVSRLLDELSSGKAYSTAEASVDQYEAELALAIQLSLRSASQVMHVVHDEESSPMAGNEMTKGMDDQKSNEMCRNIPSPLPPPLSQLSSVPSFSIFGANDREFVKSQHHALRGFENEPRGHQTTVTFSSSATTATTAAVDDGMPQGVARSSTIVQQGARETRQAVDQGISQMVKCQNCHRTLQVAITYKLVYCPVCRTVSPC
jgi:hypothetical protein